MKKKLLALALAAAMPMAAQAGVTIYGKAHLSIDFVDADGADGVYDVESRASRLGFKGSEDLGDGLKMIWKIESQVNMADGGTYWKGRNAYIGLAGGFGTFLYGRHDTPMKMSTGKMDIFGDTIADYNNTAGIVDVRANDAIAYVSPKMGGLTIAAAIVPDADYDADGDLAGGYSLAAMWGAGGISVSAAYESLDDLVGGADLTHWRIGAGYKADSFMVNAIYADEDDFGNGDVWQINGGFMFGNNTLKASYSDVDGSDAWALGLDHNFSKRSKMYVIYADSEHGLSSTNNSATGDTAGFSFGMVHSF